MTYESSNSREIEGLKAEELVKRIREAMSQGCIHPCHVYDMVDEVLQRYLFVVDSNKCLEEDLARLRKGMVAQCHCRHFRGLHENDYSDCLVVCGKFTEDYVSLSACQVCGDFELACQEKKEINETNDKPRKDDK